MRGRLRQELFVQEEEEAEDAEEAAAEGAEAVVISLMIALGGLSCKKSVDKWEARGAEVVVVEEAAA